MRTLVSFRLLFILILLLQLTSVNMTVNAAPTSTYVVDTTAETDDDNPGNNICADENGDCSLRAAVMEANAHAGEDTITLPANTYNLTQVLHVTDHLVINGGGRDITILHGNGVYSETGFYIDTSDNLALNHLSMTNFRLAIELEGTISSQVTLTNCALHDNINQDPTKYGSAIRIFCAGCSVNLFGSLVYNNKSPTCGAIQNASTLGISQFSQVYGNEATYGFGGAICNSGDLSISRSLVYGNQAIIGAGSKRGGAIHQSEGSTTIGISQLYNNTAEEGGAIFASNGSVTIQNSEIDGNTATSLGGGLDLWQETTLTVEESSLQNNNAQFGSGIYIEGDAHISSSSIVSNTASIDGGGIYVRGGTNRVVQIDITNTTFSGNRSERNGAGISTYMAAVVRLASVTIYNNTADYDDDGNGTGGGIYQDGGSVEIYFMNSIIAYNKDLTVDIWEPWGPDCVGDLVSYGYNLIGIDNALCTITGTTTGNLVGAVSPGLDPHLGALSNNGLLYYHPLLSGPAVDRGNPTGCTDYDLIPLLEDQMGNPRPYTAASSGYTPRCDMGAIEAQMPRFDRFLPLLRK